MKQLDQRQKRDGKLSGNEWWNDAAGPGSREYRKARSCLWHWDLEELRPSDTGHGAVLDKLAPMMDGWGGGEIDYGPSAKVTPTAILTEVAPRCLTDPEKQQSLLGYVFRMGTVPDACDCLEVRRLLLAPLLKHSLSFWTHIGFGDAESWAYLERDRFPDWPEDKKPKSYQVPWPALGFKDKETGLSIIADALDGCRQFVDCLHKSLAELPPDEGRVLAHSLRAGAQGLEGEEEKKLDVELAKVETHIKAAIAAHRLPAAADTERQSELWGEIDLLTANPRSRTPAETARDLGDINNQGQRTRRRLGRAQRRIAEQIPVELICAAWCAGLHDQLYWLVRREAEAARLNFGIAATSARKGDKQRAQREAARVWLDFLTSEERFNSFWTLFRSKWLRLPNAEDEGQRQETFAREAPVSERRGWGDDTEEFDYLVLFQQRRHILKLKTQEERERYAATILINRLRRRAREEAARAKKAQRAGIEPLVEVTAGLDLDPEKLTGFKARDPRESALSLLGVVDAT